jgi:hypothetical protein
MYKQQALGGYNNDDDLCSYSFSFTDRQGTHVNMSFQAEPEYDLSVVFQQFRKFLIASGHDVEGEVGELYHEDDEWDDNPTGKTWQQDSDAYREAAVQNFQHPRDKFSMDNLPNNGWPFGTLTTASIAALTTADIAPLTVTNLDTNKTYAYKDMLMQNPTMAPLTSQQIQAWSLSSTDIKSLTVADVSSWTFPSPGTSGGAKVKF